MQKHRKKESPWYWPQQDPKIHLDHLHIDIYHLVDCQFNWRFVLDADFAHNRVHEAFDQLHPTSSLPEPSLPLPTPPTKNVFIQAKRPDKVFMHIPWGFKSKPGHCLQLILNVYSACNEPKLWADLLFKSLKKLGFVQSKIDLCLWYQRTCFLNHICRWLWNLHQDGKRSWWPYQWIEENGILSNERKFICRDPRNLTWNIEK